jgi:hypothetical protein
MVGVFLVIVRRSEGKFRIKDIGELEKQLARDRIADEYNSL